MESLLKQIKYPKSFWILLIASFLSIWGYGTQRVIVPVQMKMTGDDIFLIGFYLSLFGLPRAIMNIVGGHLSDKFSKKYNIIYSILLFGVISIVLIGVTESNFYLGLWRILLAIGLSWGQTAMLAYMAEITLTTIRGTAFGFQKMTTWIGMALSSFLAPILIAYFGVSFLMYIMAFLSLISVVLLYIYLLDLPNGKHNKTDENVDEKKEIKITACGKKQYVFWEKAVLSLNGLLMKLIEDGIITFFIPIYILTHFESFISIGLIISIYTAVYVISQPLGGILADIYGSMRVMIFAFIFNFTAIVLLFYTTKIFDFYIFSTLAGIGSGVVVTSAEMRASMIGEEGKRSQTLGMWRFYRDMGSFFGPLIVGLSLSFGSERLLYYLVLGTLVFAFIFMLIYVFYNNKIDLTKKEEKSLMT